MKLDVWQAISDLLDAGGKLEHGRYQIMNSKGQLHRDNGPAAIYPDGTQCWYRNGQRHRDDGPAIIHPDGTEIWCQDGQRKHKAGD